MSPSPRLLCPQGQGPQERGRGHFEELFPAGKTARSLDMSLSPAFSPSGSPLQVAGRPLLSALRAPRFTPWALAGSPELLGKGKACFFPVSGTGVSPCPPKSLVEKHRAQS